MYRIHSTIYRTIWEHNYKNTPITIYKNVDDIVAFIKTLIWTADSWKQLFDAISYPGTVECIGYYGNKKIGDCDEFAIYIATALEKSIENKYITHISNPKLLTVTWIEPDGRPAGHNVCLFSYPDTKSYGYMDYGYPIDKPTIKEIVDIIIQRYTPGSVCIVWAISDPRTLRPEQISWGL